ncbi:MAG: hypothetical protein B7Y08_04425 [Rhodospirillales bacterium 24-66-33]|nr:MAG: hypothetical protein B7Y57_04065 [Rhodospirillales bacterium 35-66-84]OYZ96416.1 MAG: hypothetical protein B7Y08_04425 [Rhodospirillales bacterium 24-66-33]
MGIELIHVPYRGGADAARDICGGAVDSVIIATNSIRPPGCRETRARAGCRGRSDQGSKMKERLDPTGADLVATRRPSSEPGSQMGGRSASRCALRSRRRNLHRSVYAACSFTL